ncbi:hypothetical protein RB195_007339 [Necator americanus]|uniref:C2H2-type domain-containing protein n=1 Tax=Necator americanus TaxID=51031 RepID=A0ABR1BZT3_NECAM
MDSSCLPSVSTRSDCCTATLVPACRVSTDHEAPQAGCDAFLSWVKRDSHNHQRVLFVCMWGQCFHEMEAKDELAAHFDVHLSSYVNEMSGNDSWICPINTCSQLAASPIDLRRHLAMHQFQAHAQYVGLLMLAAKYDLVKLERCGFQPSLDITYSGEVTYCLWDNCNHDFSDPLDLFTHVMIHGTFQMLLGELFSAFRIQGRFEEACAPDKLYEHLHKRAPLAVNVDSQLCLLCQRRFGDERSLMNHVRRHINGRQCPTCGLAVPLPSDLHRHILVKHTERVKSFVCEECTKSFYCANDLLRHGKLHAPPNEICPTCGERFRWKKQLVKHMSSHSETTLDRPYLCHLCNSTYATGHGLTRHLSRKHDCPVPEGFSRFSYKKCADGCYRLQTRKLVRTVLYEK